METAGSLAVVQIAHSLAFLASLQFSIELNPEMFNNEHLITGWRAKGEAFSTKVQPITTTVARLISPGGRNISLELGRHFPSKNESSEWELDLLFEGVKLVRLKRETLKGPIAVEILCENGLWLKIKTSLFFTTEKQKIPTKTIEKRIASPALCDPEKQQYKKDGGSMLFLIGDGSSDSGFFGCIRNLSVTVAKNPSAETKFSTKRIVPTMLLNSWCRELPSFLKKPNLEGGGSQRRALEQPAMMLVEQTPSPRLSIGPKGPLITGLTIGTKVPLDDSFLRVEGADPDQEIVLEHLSQSARLEDAHGHTLIRFSVSQFRSGKVFVTSDGGGGEFRLGLLPASDEDEDSEEIAEGLPSSKQSSSTMMAPKPLSSVTFRVTPVSVHLMLQKNTGIRLYHQSAMPISAQNLSFTTNFPGEVPIRYSVVDQPEYGVIECQRREEKTLQQPNFLGENNNQFQLCSNFGQEDIDLKKVRYRQTASYFRPTDSFSFQAQAGDASSIVYVFHITFVPISVRVSLDRPLELNGTTPSVAEGVRLTKKQLQAVAFPENLPPESFTYTVVEAPKLGMLTRFVPESGKRRRVGISSNFTQKHIEDELINYRLNGPSLQPLDDFFTFRLSSPSSVLSDRLFRMDIAYRPPPKSLVGEDGISEQQLENFQTRNLSLIVSEGGAQTIGASVFWPLEESGEGILGSAVSRNNSSNEFVLIVPPLNGQLFRLSSTKDKNSTRLDVGNVFTGDDITSNRILYQHSGDETSADRIALFSRKFQKVPIWLGVSVLPDEDRPPRPQTPQLHKTEAKSTIHILERNSRVIYPSLFRWVDPDQLGPTDRAIAPHSMVRSLRPLAFSFADSFRNFIIARKENPEVPVRNFTIEELRRCELFLKHLGPAYEGVFRYTVYDGRHLVPASMKFSASHAPFVRMASSTPGENIATARFFVENIRQRRNNPFLLKDRFLAVSLAQLSAETNADVDPDEIEFSVRLTRSSSAERKSPFWVLSPNGTLSEALSFLQKDVAENLIFLSLDDLIRIQKQLGNSGGTGATKLTITIPLSLTTPKGQLKAYSALRSQTKPLQSEGELLVKLWGTNGRSASAGIPLNGNGGLLSSWSTSTFTFSLGLIQQGLRIDQEGAVLSAEGLSIEAMIMDGGFWPRLKYLIVEPPKLGILVFETLNQSLVVRGFSEKDLAAGRIRYRPEHAFSGTDRFSVTFALSFWDNPSLSSGRLRDELLPPLGPFSVTVQIATPGDDLLPQFLSSNLPPTNWLPENIPKLVRNMPLRIPQSRLSAPITAEVLKLSPIDETMALESLRFSAWGLVGGRLELFETGTGGVEHRKRSIYTFTQADIHAGRVHFTVLKEETMAQNGGTIGSGGISIESFRPINIRRRRVDKNARRESREIKQKLGFYFVYEVFGVQNPTDHWFNVELEANAEAGTNIASVAQNQENLPEPHLGRNRRLSGVSPGTPAAINSSLLKASLQGRSPEQIVYKITRQPFHGRLSINGSYDGLVTSPVVERFTQADINAQRLSYRARMDIGSWSQRDSFYFKLLSSVDHGPIVDQREEHKFKIYMSYANTPPTALHRLVQLQPLHVSWNGSVALNGTHVNLTKLASFCCRDDQLVVELRRQPQKGWIERVGDPLRAQVSAKESPERSSSVGSQQGSFEKTPMVENNNDSTGEDEDDDDDDDDEASGGGKKGPMSAERIQSGRGLIYRHRAKTNFSPPTEDDAFTLVVFASRERYSHRAKLRIPVRVIIEPKLNPVLATKVVHFRHELRVVSGGNVQLSGQDFQAAHPSVPSQSIIYRLVQPPSSGFLRFLFAHQNQSSKTDEGFLAEKRPIEKPPAVAEETRQFTQSQLDAGSIWLEHVPSAMDQQFEDSSASSAGNTDGGWRRYDTAVFRIGPVGEERGAQTRVLVIKVEPLALRLVNHTEISYVQGRTYAVLSNRHLGAESNDRDRSRIVYNVTRRPSNGTFYWVEGEKEAWVFTQRDLDEGALLYAQLNMNAFQDHFEFVLSNDEVELLPKLARIVVLPLAQSRTLKTESRTLSQIGLLNLNASALEGTSPRYLVVSAPKHGRLIHHTYPNESATFFTHDDVKSGRIYFHSFDISDMEEELVGGRALTDTVELELRSDTTQPARFRWSIEIRPQLQSSHSSPKAEISTSTEAEPQDSDLQTADVAFPKFARPPPPEMNYHFPIFILIAVVAVVIIILLCRKNVGSRGSDGGSETDESRRRIKARRPSETRQQRLRRLLQMPPVDSEHPPILDESTRNGGGTASCGTMASIARPNNNQQQLSTTTTFSSSPLMPRSPYRNGGDLLPPPSSTNFYGSGENGRGLLSAADVYGSPARSPAAISSYDNAITTPTHRVSSASAIGGLQEHRHHNLWQHHHSPRRRTLPPKRDWGSTRRSQQPPAPPLSLLPPRASIDAPAGTGLFPLFSRLHQHLPSVTTKRDSNPKNLLAFAAAAAAARGFPEVRWASPPMEGQEESSIPPPFSLIEERHQSILSPTPPILAAKPTLVSERDLDSRTELSAALTITRLKDMRPEALLQTEAEDSPSSRGGMVDARDIEADENQQQDWNSPELESVNRRRPQPPLRKNEFWV